MIWKLISGKSKHTPINIREAHYYLYCFVEVDLLSGGGSFFVNKRDSITHQVNNTRTSHDKAVNRPLLTSG